MRDGFLSKIGELCLVTVLVSLALLLCVPTSFTEDDSMTFSLQSQSFPPNADIPTKFTCKGQNVSPALSWNEPPSGTADFALIVRDPDAPNGDFTHWLVYQIPAATRQLAEGASGAMGLPKGALEGRNDFSKIGYGGPCPPPGKPHRYVFTVYALNNRLSLPAGASREQLEKAMQGHVIGQAGLTSRFGR